VDLFSAPARSDIVCQLVMHVAVPARSTTLIAFRARRALAFYTLLAFAGGFLVLPCLHNLAHRSDHEHGADGFSIRWRNAGQVEHTEAHRHARPHTHAPAAAGEGSPGLRQPIAPHGDGGAGHFAAAALAAPAFICIPPPARLPDRQPAARPQQTPALFSFAVANPRGPPVG
jgi:hypothetical protein